MQKARRAARELALNLVYQVDAMGIELDEAIETAREHASAPAAVFEYAEMLVRGTYEGRKEIDEVIKRLSKDWPIGRQPAVDRNILRLAIYEMSEEQTTPEAVVVNEAVELAKKYSTADSSKFVNGVLGAYLRERKEQIPDAAPKDC
jgi:transcription antitermination protein NusB